MKYSLPDIIAVLIIFQGLFFAAFLSSSKKGNRKSNLLLAYLSGCLSLHFLNMTLLKQSPHFPNFGPVFGLLYGPLLFHYTQSLVYKKIRSYGDRWLHYLPAILFLIFISLLSTRAISFNSLLIDWATLPIIAHLSCYLYYAFRLINRYHEALQNLRSSLEKLTLSWLQFIIYSMFCAPILVLAEYLLSSYFPEPFRLISESLIYLFVLFLMSSFIYNGLKHPELFSGLEKEDLDKKPIYGDDYLENVPDLLKQLEDFMKEHKPFLEAGLSLEALAKKLNVSPRQLSSLINRELKQNFFEYINQHRVEEAKRLLDLPSHTRNRINEIMYDAGFNSKSSFNNIFKKHTGLTPSQFKKRLK